jgi:formamidopyrimidine-DNA glycosylase
VPELPDLTVYLEHLDVRIQGRILQRVRIANPFLLRTAVPPVSSAEGKAVTGLRRIGKRIVIALDGELFLVIHLMIAGRLRWSDEPGRKTLRNALAFFDFAHGTLVFTEAGTKRRASLHVVQGETALAAMDPGGIEVMDASLAAFATQLKCENHTLKRALTDPHLFGGIGNAYSDEILHRAKLSPVSLTQSLTEPEVATLFEATKATLAEWTKRLRADAGDAFPEKVTAFRDEMAAHGKYGKPCPTCGSPIQRIVYAENETNYCARCQTKGRVLADRALSRLLKKSWPRSIDGLG